MISLLGIIPVGIMIFSYVYLALEQGTWNIWPLVLHAQNELTFLETFFYFDHLVREILISVMMAASVTAGYALHAGRINSNHRRAGQWAIGVASVIIVGSFAGSVLKVGFFETLVDFFQFRITNEQMGFGIHWWGHIFQILFLMPASLALGYLLRLITRFGTIEKSSEGARLIGKWTVAVIVFSVVFIPRPEFFIDTKSLGHNMREIITHATLTLPLSFFLLALLESRGGFAKLDFVPRKWFGRFLVFSLLALVLPVYILWMVRGQDMQAAAPGDWSLMHLWAYHNFEHLLDVILVASFSVLMYLSMSKKQLERV